MKKNFLIVMCLMMAFMASAQDLVVCSYNIRNANRGDAKNGNGWEKRSVYMCQQIQFEDPGVFGCQEVKKEQIDDMLRLMPEYAYVGVGREDGKEGGEYSPVFYKKDRYKLLDSGTFWLAEDPTKAELGWDAACKRVCSWGHFKDLKTKHTFYFFNTHMDHIGVTARREGAKLIVSKMRELMKKNDPVILTGDFNVDQRSEPFQVFINSGFLNDCYEVSKYRFATNGTFNDFNPLNCSNSRIDHIFVSKNFKVDRYAIRTDGYWDNVEMYEAKPSPNAPMDVKLKEGVRRNPSDHYPVVVKMRF